MDGRRWYHVAELRDGVKPIPIDADPLAALREACADVDATVDELRDGARDAVLNEAGR
ncbi:hypothetical protein ACFPM1_09160 [Halorubrum rubrum]|uniref:Uncharacterized protein n=1 Tax=Halorubrum rubrum TaxID=1126240 RepID=A0ABD5R211_9EURY|nr:hypothetical protein [Halorubrum rubrum]